jgi:hypothetical protein
MNPTQIQIMLIAGSRATQFTLRLEPILKLMAWFAATRLKQFIRTNRNSRSSPASINPEVHFRVKCLDSEGEARPQ